MADSILNITDEDQIGTSSTASGGVKQVHIQGALYDFIDTKMREVFTQLNGKMNSITDVVYPVGALYWSADNTDPSTLFGGTWERIKDKFILAAGDNYDNLSTGGKYTISYTPTGTVENHQLTISEIPVHHHSVTDPGHTHSIKTYGGSDETATEIANFVTDYGDTDFSSTNTENGIQANNSKTNITIDDTGGDGSHNHEFTGDNIVFDNMPPYQAFYCWKRIS